MICKKEQDNPKDIDQSANSPVSVWRSAAHGSDSYDDMDWHELAKVHLDADLADLLYDLVHKSLFEQIVLVVSPQGLGELRDKLHQELCEKVVAEISKTRINHPISDIEKIVLAELAA